MSSAWTIAVGVALALWLIASAIHQFRWERWTRIAACDVLHLLPRWTFFAPNPGCSDIHLVVRFWRQGQPEGWQPLDLPFDARWHWWLWNPSRFSRKATMDLANELRRARSAAGDTPRTVLLSRGYICLLRWAMCAGTAPPCIHADPGDTQGNDASDGVQFALVLTQGFDSERQLELDLISDVHPTRS